jgi:hypothetical protein
MGKSVLAFVAAVAMVVGALAIRSSMDDGGDTGANRSGALELVCATELRQACELIDATQDGVNVTVEAATITADRLKSIDRDKAEIDGWLAPGPWGELVNASRGPGTGELFAPSDAALARSPFVLAVWKDKRAQLACADPVDLGCLGDAVITRGFRLGAAADDQAEGVLGDAALGAGHIKNPNFATNDLGETDLADWLTGVDAGVDSVGRNPGGRSFAEMLAFGPAVADGFLSTEAAVGPQLARAAKRNLLDLIQVAPVATADVQFAPSLGERGRRLAEIVRSDRVRDALRSTGWRVTGDARPLPKDDGLPSAGVLQALRNVTT